jgi:hypothetical protein
MAYGTPQVRTFYEGPLRVGFDFTSGPIANSAISKIADSPVGFVRRTTEA